MKKFLVVAAFGLGLFVLGVGTLILLVRRDHEAIPREEQVYDDFGFSVAGAERTGERCTIELQVANHAQRVSYLVTNFHVRLVDAGGLEYEERRELATRPCAEILAGEAVVEKHVFDLPRDARRVVLEVSFGKFDDALDWLFLGKRTWRLP